MVFKGGDFVAAATGPEVDKYQGMKIASMMQMGFQPDRLLIVLDSHFVQSLPGETAEDMHRKYPPGSMQKMCDEEGACEAGEISDCLVLASIDKDKKFEMDILPYDYHGKGTQFRWKFLPDELGVALKDSFGHHEGFIPSSLTQIMSQNSAEFVDEMAKKFDPEIAADPERCSFHTGRAVLSALKLHGCSILDKWSDRFPLGREWIPEEHYDII